MMASLAAYVGTWISQRQIIKINQLESALGVSLRSASTCCQLLFAKGKEPILERAVFVSVKMVPYTSVDAKNI